MWTERPWVPSRIDRGELDPAVLVGHLITAQETLPASVKALCAIDHARVLPMRVALPHIHNGAGERTAIASGNLRDVERQGQRNAGAQSTGCGIEAQVSSTELFVDEVRSLGLLRRNDAAREPTGRRLGRCQRFRQPEFRNK